MSEVRVPNSKRADLTVKEFSELTGMHPDTVYSKIKAGDLPGFYQIGGRGAWRIPRVMANRLRGLHDDGTAVTDTDEMVRR